MWSRTPVAWAAFHDAFLPENPSPSTLATLPNPGQLPAPSHLLAYGTCLRLCESQEVILKPVAISNSTAPALCRYYGMRDAVETPSKGFYLRSRLIREDVQARSPVAFTLRATSHRSFGTQTGIWAAFSRMSLCQGPSMQQASCTEQCDAPVFAPRVQKTSALSFRGSEALFVAE